MTYLDYLVQYWTEWITHQSRVVRDYKKRKKFALLPEIVEADDIGLIVQIVTLKSGYPMGSCVLPYCLLKKHCWVDVESRLNRLYQGARLRVLKPEEYAILGEEPAMFDRYPTLWWFLTSDFTQAGKARVRARLNVWVEGQRWTGFVRDNNTHLLLWGTGETLEALLDVLEARLANGSPLLWRTDRYLTGKSSRKTDRPAT